MLSRIGKNSILPIVTKTLNVRTRVDIVAKSHGISTQRFISNDGSRMKGPAIAHTILKKKPLRILSTLSYTKTLEAYYSTLPKTDHEEFISVFPDILHELTETAKHYGCEDTAKWFEKSLKYNVTCGKRNRGVATVLGFKAIASPEIMTPENLKLAQYLGWCIELLGATVIILDDIMDDSETRRGLPCWYKFENIKMAGINDAFMIETGIYVILKKFFSHTSYYVKLLELFHETMFYTSIGESLDLQSANLSVDEFTMERHEAIALNKTGIYSFYLPLALAMHMAGHSDPEELRQLKEITKEMANFFQIQDDFLDCFGDPNMTGKVGSDIQDGKCTWLSIVCMQRATEEQKNIMRENYGQNDPQKVAVIKKLYEDLELPKAYAMYEHEAFIPIIQTNKIGKLYQDIYDHFWKRAHSFTSRTNRSIPPHVNVLATR